MHMGSLLMHRTMYRFQTCKWCIHTDMRVHMHMHMHM